LGLANLKHAAILKQSITENSREMQRLVDLCYNKPLYIWWESKHQKRYEKTGGNCCIWHILGPETKDGKDMPMLPYQRVLYQALQNNKRIWIKKARGLGVTTYFLYHIAWLCLTGTQLQPGDRISVVVGPRLEAAQDWLDRFKSLVSRKFPNLFDKDKSTVAILNQVKLEIFPSHHVSAMRGYTRLRFIMADEADYFPPGQQKEVRAVVEGYIGKPNSDSQIVFSSTPAAPQGLMQQIELEQNSLYYKCFFTYEYGLEGPYPIYSLEQIEQAKRSPDFRREFAGEYLGLIGNVFNVYSINKAVMHGTKYSNLTPENWTKGVHTLLAIDPAYGSTSKYGIVMCQYLDQKIVVIYAHEYTKPDYSEMIDEVFRLSRQVGGVTNILVDSSAPEVIASIRRSFHKDQYSDNYLKEVVANCKKYNVPIENRLFVVPKSFTMEGRQMLQHAVSIMDIPEGAIAIPSQYQDLIVACRTATAEEWKLDKPNTSHNDLLDSFLMCLSVYKFSK
jgi:hypothetical protein